MKRLLGLLLVMGTVGCGGGKTVDLSKMTQRGGLMYEVNSETPFTGVVVTKLNNGQKAWEATYKYGKPHGLETQWYYSGEKSREATYKDGKKVSETKWDKEGNEIKD